VPGTGPRWRQWLAVAGPALLVSVGYMDPGNWATDIAGGSQYEYRLLWVLLVSNLMAILLQSLAARLGLVRGRDLAQASRESYPPLLNLALYLLAEVAIAATDLAEVIGSAIALSRCSACRSWPGCCSPPSTCSCCCCSPGSASASWRR